MDGGLVSIHTGLKIKGWGIINLHAWYYNERWDRVKFACHCF